MPVPFEALLPLGIIATMFGVAGAGIGFFQRTKSLGKVRLVFVIPHPVRPAP
jgi:hypothetical protein